MLEVIPVYQFSSVAQSFPTLCYTMNLTTPGLPVHHQLLEFTQTHVHRVGDNRLTISSSIIPFSSCPQSCPASGSFQMSQLFTSSGQVLKFQLQHQSFQWIFRTDFLWIDWLDLLAVQGTRKSSPTPQFKRINSSALTFLYSPTLTSIHKYWKNHSFD